MFKNVIRNNKSQNINFLSHNQGKNKKNDIFAPIGRDEPDSSNGSDKVYIFAQREQYDSISNEGEIR